jgi:hypothetical protein
MLKFLNIDISLFGNILNSLVLSLKLLVFDVSFGDVGFKSVDISLQIGDSLEINVISALEVRFGSELEGISMIIKLGKYVLFLPGEGYNGVQCF